MMIFVFRIGSHVWLYDGAEGGRWLQNLRQELTSQLPTPVSFQSGTSTRLSTFAPGDRKRVLRDNVEDEPAIKRVKSGQS